MILRKKLRSIKSLHKLFSNETSRWQSDSESWFQTPNSIIYGLTIVESIAEVPDHNVLNISQAVNRYKKVIWNTEDFDSGFWNQKKQKLFSSYNKPSKTALSWLIENCKRQTTHSFPTLLIISSLRYNNSKEIFLYAWNYEWRQ